MKFETSKQVATYEKKPHIEKGYYCLQLTEVKPRQKEDGTPVINKFGGTQVILMFRILDKKTLKPLTVKDENAEKDLELPLCLNDKYKIKGTENFRTGFTPNALITKVFRCLGWTGELGTPVESDPLIGKYVEGNIDDYEAEWSNDKGEKEKYKASAIKDVNKWEGGIPSSSQPQPIATDEIAPPQTFISHIPTLAKRTGMVCNSCYRRNDCHALPNEYNKSLTGEVVECKIYVQEEQVNDEEIKKDIEDNKKKLVDIKNRIEQANKDFKEGNLTEKGYMLLRENLERMEAMLI